MTAKETRAQARDALKGQWGKAILFLIIYAIVTMVLSIVLGFIPFVGKVMETIISVPLVIGLTATLIKIKRKEEFGYFDFINVSIEMFGKSWGVFGHTLLKMLVPVILLVVSTIIISVGIVMLGANELSMGTINMAALLVTVLGSILYIISMIWTIIKGYLYSLTSAILADNEDMPTLKVVEKSEALMNGNRMKLFLLSLSFIGWGILSTLTFGIGLIWLVPYMSIAQICFYDNLLGNTEIKEAQEISE